MKTNPDFILDVTWQGQEGRLTLHYDNGFTLSDARPEDGRKSQIFWHFPFEKLRMSADDGIRLLWLDFGEEGEQVMVVKYGLALLLEICF